LSLPRAILQEDIMRKRVGARPDLFQPEIGLPEFLSSKAVELLRRLLIEAITPGLAEGEENDGRQEGDNDHR
jgi:hypothetical protein